MMLADDLNGRFQGLHPFLDALVHSDLPNVFICGQPYLVSA